MMQVRNFFHNFGSRRLKINLTSKRELKKNSSMFLQSKLSGLISYVLLPKKLVAIRGTYFVLDAPSFHLLSFSAEENPSLRFRIRSNIIFSNVALRRSKLDGKDGCYKVEKKQR
jgi:hypothetical protein